ncbi:hypothetical protein CHU93_02375 [Sandarakinorhabdus cyanobacteriorum]|uniref:Uncharacterized protein n=1 Tax=Sandarakinorhabdus cyanobacteriorum TaxID=1981098 RepID=A0A255Z1C7_9SPHN|nr:hypothetical protein CHU93_02375 [Sandarakinorhabdus cyanobacteriorum]
MMPSPRPHGNQVSALGIVFKKPIEQVDDAGLPLQCVGRRFRCKLTEPHRHFGRSEGAQQPIVVEMQTVGDLDRGSSAIHKLIAARLIGTTHAVILRCSLRHLDSTTRCKRMTRAGREHFLQPLEFFLLGR